MDLPTASLFRPWAVGALRLRNRVIMAPMTRRMAAEDGVPTAAMADYYRRRGAGEVGLIVSEGTAIDSRHAWDTLTVPRFETDAQIDGWARIVDAVHAEGGAFAPQLWHTGRLAADPIGPSGGAGPPRADGTPRPPAREMTEADFAQVLDAYASAARRARAIGCDAVEIHGAHGYLLDSFLNPAANRRSDRYGGPLANRMRFPLEVARAVRGAVGHGFPVLYRFSQWSTTTTPEVKFHGPAELASWVAALREAGVDILHVSARSALDPAFPEDGLRTLAGWSRELSGLPVIAVGMATLTLPMDRSHGAEPDAVSDPAPWIELIERGEADLLGVGRALIANPDWVPLVRAGRWRELRPWSRALLAELV